MLLIFKIPGQNGNLRIRPEAEHTIKCLELSFGFFLYLQVGYIRHTIFRLILIFFAHYSNIYCYCYVLVSCHHDPNLSSSLFLSLAFSLQIENLLEQLKDKDKQLAGLRERVQGLQTDSSNTDTALATLEEALSEKVQNRGRAKERVKMSF